MKKFIKLISLVMIAVLCVGSTVFAADYNMYTNATGKLTGDVDTGLWEIKVIPRVQRDIQQFIQLQKQFLSTVLNQVQKQKKIISI